MTSLLRTSARSVLEKIGRENLQRCHGNGCRRYTANRAGVCTFCLNYGEKKGEQR